MSCLALAAASGLVGCQTRGPGPDRAQVREATSISIDPYCVRGIRGISELNRDAYFGLCDAGSSFDERCQSKERYDFLVKENGITFGRRLGVVKGLDRWYKAIKEDPARPGFVDEGYLAGKLAVRLREPGDAFRRDMSGRLDVAAHGNHNSFPEFMGKHLSEQTAREEKGEYLPENIEAAARLSAATLRCGFTDFDRPAYYEPVNEPHWSYWGGEHLSSWHTRTMEVVHQEVPGVLVGGPCMSVAYFYKKQYKAFDGLRGFIDNTRCELDFYSFHSYDFLRDENGTFGGRITSGLPLESVLDLVQNYTVNTYGKEIGVVLSEHGGYGADELVEKLAAEQFTETGFEWEMRKRAIDDFNMVSSVIANTLVFMDHPQTVRKAVPFILLNAMGWNPKYYAVLYVPRNYTDKSDWVATKKIFFYQLLRDLKGHRVVGTCPDPDIQMRAFVDGSTLFVVLNNLSGLDKRVSLDMPVPRDAIIRRFGRNPNYTPFLAEGPLTASDDVALGARETAVIRAEYGGALKARSAVNEVPCYGDRIGTPVAEEADFVVHVPQAEQLRYATLRIGVSRPADAGWDVDVILNGTRLGVPVEGCAERLTQAGQEYASCKIIHLDPASVKATNTITVSFPDGLAGSVGAVVIRAGLAAQ
jgi:hypothetical protein